MDVNNTSRLREDAAGLLVCVAPLDGSLEVNMPTQMRYGVMMQEGYPPQAGQQGASKMFTSMRRWICCKSVVVDVYAFVDNCVQCARSRVGKRRRTNSINTFPPAEPLTDIRFDLLGPLPQKDAGNVLLVPQVCPAGLGLGLSLRW